MKKLITFITAILAATSFAAMAQDMDPGETEYMRFCVYCHGETGQGHGELARFLTIPVPDLTGLRAANDGEFPVLKTMMIIDGRTGVRGHGSEMPIWGERYSDEAEEVVGPFAAEVVARGRLLSLVYYLESIQQ